MRACRNGDHGSAPNTLSPYLNVGRDVGTLRPRPSQAPTTIEDSYEHI